MQHRRDEVVEGELFDPEDVPLGEIVEVARRLDLAFDGRLSSEQAVPLATGVDSSDWVSSILVVVIHAFNTWATSDTTLRIEAQAVALAPDEPEVVFEGAVLGSVNIPGDQRGPAVFCAPLALAPARVRVVARWIQAGTEATGAQHAAISVKLVGRRHVAPTYRLLSEG